MKDNVVHPTYVRHWPELEAIDPNLRVRFVPCHAHKRDEDKELTHEECEEFKVTHVPMCDRWVLEMRADGEFYADIGWRGEPFEYMLVFVLESEGEGYLPPDGRLIKHLQMWDRRRLFKNWDEEFRWRRDKLSTKWQHWSSEARYAIHSARKLWEGAENPKISFRPDKVMPGTDLTRI